MKKVFLFIFLILFFIQLNSEEIKNYYNSYFGVYGKKASVMGTIDGKNLEVWIYPFKVLRDLKFRVNILGNIINPYERLKLFEPSHYRLYRRFVNENFTIDETVFPSIENQVVYLVYEIDAKRDMKLEFSFRPELNLMWPGAIGGRFSFYDEKHGTFVISEAKWKLFAGIFSSGLKKEIRLPAHKLPGGKIRFFIDIKKGLNKFNILVSFSTKNTEDLFYKLSHYNNLIEEKYNERINYINLIKEKYIKINTPDNELNKGLQDAILNTEFSFVKNLKLGEGMIAGYGLSENSERPGFLWFFGGDGIINSLAVLNYGNFEGVRKEIGFLFKYQRKDGKIIHELSQSEGYINWFNDYGFAYFHGDTTPYFITLLNEYIKRTGDVSILNKYKQKILKLFEWLDKSDFDDDGLIDTKIAGTGASETGPLRQEMKTDILLSSLSVSSWRAFINIFNFMDLGSEELKARKFYNISRKTIEKLFWNKKDKYYSYAVKNNGKKIDELTIWPAIGIRFNSLNSSHSKLFVKKILSPMHTTDWGNRFLSNKSGYYDPLSYNNGAVWPFLTGFASLAVYKSMGLTDGYDLLMSNIRIINDFDYSRATEVLSGDNYIPLNQSVPDQIWSSANTISAFVEGLLGLDVNVLKKEIKLKSSFPVYWGYFELKNIRAGKGYFDLIYNINKNNKVKVKIIARDLNGFRIFYYKNKTINSKPVEININDNDFAKEICFVLKDYLYVYSEKNKLKPGDKSVNTIISDYYLKKNNLYIELWSKLKQRVFIISDKRIKDNSQIKQIDKDLYVFYTHNSKNYKFYKFKFELEKEEK